MAVLLGVACFVEDIFDILNVCELLLLTIFF